MKKMFAGAVVGLAMGVFSMASAIDMSWGVFSVYTGDWGGGISYEGETTILTGEAIIRAENKIPYAGYGVGLFFDMTYSELSLGVIAASIDQTITARVQDKATGIFVEEKTEGKGSFLALDIGVLGKYPIVVAEGITVFPAAGFMYRSIITEGNPFDAPWVKFGGGIDISYGSKQKYVRFDLLYGVKLAGSEFEKNDIKSFETLYGKGKSDTFLSHGLTFKAGLSF